MVVRILREMFKVNKEVKTDQHYKLIMNVDLKVVQALPNTILVLSNKYSLLINIFDIRLK